MTPLDAARKLVKGWPTAPSMRGTVPAGVAVDVARALLDLVEECDFAHGCTPTGERCRICKVLDRLRTERSPDEPA